MKIKYINHLILILIFLLVPRSISLYASSGIIEPNGRNFKVDFDGNNEYYDVNLSSMNRNLTITMSLSKNGKNIKNLILPESGHIYLINIRGKQDLVYVSNQGSGGFFDSLTIIGEKDNQISQILSTSLLTEPQFDNSLKRGTVVLNNSKIILKFINSPNTVSFWWDSGNKTYKYIFNNNSLQSNYTNNTAGGGSNSESKVVFTGRDLSQYPNAIKNPDGSWTLKVSQDTIKILDDIDAYSKSLNSNFEKENLEKLKEDVVIKALQGTYYIFANDKISQLIKQNGAIAKEYANNHKYNLFANLAFFFNNVKGGGRWDLKQQTDWQYPYKTFDGKELNGDEKNYKPFMYYEGTIVSGADVGNINYGYTGVSMGFPKFILFSAAGAYNQYQNIVSMIMKHKTTAKFRWVIYPSLGDDPDDFKSTTKGMVKYDIDSEVK
ncbi:hypothetical protein SOV_50510 [Sporomusa ovata DSM 2662]|uniref:Bacterial toxin 44 domain-containing protein n=1 Tax=Sporomusa ovata TaxID=2378 RepID=A0A0U1L0R6_9FIRM|nr:polymorphic toxin type 44 domain-containing protein [Sporomusa ovata]EQB27424.1 hypothetical protein SOV_2c03200 [Sporomusa ovata DSM 2662]CQR73270.1 hypothetical protein SpAn4DRAFT_2502 [Sporomusa ovata]